MGDESTDLGVHNVRERLARVEEGVKHNRDLLDEREKQMSLTFLAVDRAVNKAEEAQQRVNLSQNEFRGALKDQASQMATKLELDRVAERVGKIENTISSGLGESSGTMQTKQLMMQIVTIIVSIIAAIIAVAVTNR